jgi:hypothetical protein
VETTSHQLDNVQLEQKENSNEQRISVHKGCFSYPQSTKTSNRRTDTTTIPNDRFCLSFHICYYHPSLLTLINQTQCHCLMRHNHLLLSKCVMLSLILIHLCALYKAHCLLLQGLSPDHSIHSVPHIF